jgi:lysozyme
MKISNYGEKLIKHFESLHDGDLKQIGLQPKMCPSGIWTEGWGHAIVYNGKFLKGIENKDLAFRLATVFTESDADKLFKSDIEEVCADVEGRLTVQLKQHEFDALVSHAYNCGLSPTLFRMINTKTGDLKEFWTSRYVTADGIKMKGLVRRRAVEYNLYATGELNL